MPTLLEKMDYETYRAKIDAANVRIGELTAERDRAAKRSPAEIAAPAMLAALIDATAMLEHYASGKRDNWDGSTKGQALATIREGQAAIAAAKGAANG